MIRHTMKDIYGRSDRRFVVRFCRGYEKMICIEDLRRSGFPPSVSDTPNIVREQPWQTWFTVCSFGFSLILAIAVTFGIEKPVGKWLERRRIKAPETH